TASPPGRPSRPSTACAGSPPNPRPAPEGPVDEAIEGFIYYLKVERGRSENTLQAYRHDLRRFAAWLDEQGVRAPGEVTHALLADHLVALDRQGIGLRSIARARTSLRQLFMFLVKEGHL